jgi:hypothetical protein
MSCDEALPLLPLLVLDSLQPSTDEALRAHVVGCARCRERRDQLAWTRRQLDSLPTPHARPTDVAALLARTEAVPHREPASPPSHRSLRRAAAGLLLAAGAGFAGGRLGRPAAPPTAPSIEPASGGFGADAATRLANACLMLDDRLTALEIRQERDLIELARAVDASHAARDAAYSTQLTTLASLAGREFQEAREAITAISGQLVVRTANYVTAGDESAGRAGGGRLDGPDDPGD